MCNQCFLAASGKPVDIFKIASFARRVAIVAFCKDGCMFVIRGSVRLLWAFNCAQISGLTRGIIIAVQFAGVGCFELVVF